MLSTATQIAQWCNGWRRGEDPMLSGVSIDSRRVRAGDLFVALPGARVDGHDFVADAIRVGASSAMVTYPLSVGSQVVVSNCAIALARAATKWRDVYGGKIVAITGSNGKTTVKEMLAAICRVAMGEDNVYCSYGNMNNYLGVSLSVLALRHRHQIGLLETGMDTFGELLELGGICRPHIALINNAQRAHLGNFESVAAIARAKGELIQTLPADGVAVINGDDVSAQLWRQLADKRRVIAFGFGADVDYRAKRQNGKLMLPHDDVWLKPPLLGEHNINNVLAAAAAAAALEIPAPLIRRGLESFGGVSGRLQFMRFNKIVIIDDTYNANPDSMMAALAVLQECPGEKIAILGDMLALGEAATDEHHQLVVTAKAMGAQVLGIGKYMTAAINHVGGGDAFEDKESLLADLFKRLNNKTATTVTVLVKGSRGMAMEIIVKQIINKVRQQP